MGACAGCGRAGTDSRCAFCGVALAPRGYAVEKVLAQTDHGRVYRARSPDGAIVALKELQFASVPGAQQIDAFEREAATLKTLHHPRIPRYVDSFSEGEGVHLRLYLAAEFIEGEPLSSGMTLRVPRDAPLRGWIAGLVQPRRERRMQSAPASLAALEDPAPSRAVRPRFALLAAAGVAMTALSFVRGSAPAAASAPVVRTASPHATGAPSSPRQWFAMAKPFCNPVEVAQLMARRPGPSGWEGTGYVAGCSALAGGIGEPRSALARVPEQERWRAAGIVFDLGHPVADAGDDIAAAPIMNLVLESWPAHFQAL